MDSFDKMSDHQVTWLDIVSMLIILAFILGCLALVSVFAGSPQTAQWLPTDGSAGGAFDGPPQVAPANAEADERERRVLAWQ